MDHSRKLMLVGIGSGIFLFGLWTAFLMFVALLAESGKNSNPLLAVALLWPLAEVIWCWIWLLRHPEQYSSSGQRALGNALALTALILSPLFVLVVGFSGVHAPDWLLSGLSIGITIFCCRAARIVWSRPRESARDSL